MLSNDDRDLLKARDGVAQLTSLYNERLQIWCGQCPWLKHEHLGDTYRRQLISTCNETCNH